MAANTIWNREMSCSEFTRRSSSAAVRFLWPCGKDASFTFVCCRKLIHHRKETLARRSSSSTGSKPGLPSSNSDISLSQTPPPANGLSREYGRQGNMALSGSMDNMQGEQGFYQVAPGPRAQRPRPLCLSELLKIS